MKKIFCTIVIFLFCIGVCLGFCACGNKNDLGVKVNTGDADVVADVGNVDVGNIDVGNIDVGNIDVGNIDVGNVEAYADGTSPNGENGENAYGTKAKATVLSTAVYAYSAGTRIYACAEYENSGDCPIILAAAKFALGGDVNITEEFVPELNQYLVLLPGERGYVARWFPAEGLGDPAALSLEVDLTPEKSLSPVIRLDLSQLFVADNYPGFSTLSGRISCPTGASCGANMLYVGFYDENDKFIGAWYFSKNALFEGGDSKPFVMNMQDFPFNDMAERTHKMRGMGFGFDF